MNCFKFKCLSLVGVDPVRKIDEVCYEKISNIVRNYYAATQGGREQLNYWKCFVVVLRCVCCGR